MAKQQKQEAAAREVTRKEHVRRRRDAEKNRLVVIGLLTVGVLLVILIAAGIIQELVLKPRQPVATVDETRITAADYAKRVRFTWFQSTDQQIDAQTSSVQTLDQMVDESLVREQAQKLGITVSADEVTLALEKSLGYQRTPPTPEPTSAVQPTPGGPATATPAPTPTPLSLTAYQDRLKTYESELKQKTGMTEADFRALIESDLLRQKVYDAVTKDVPKTGEQVHAHHILVAIRTPEPTATPVPAGQTAPTPDPSATPTLAPRDEAQALARIIEVQQKLGSGGDFATLAKEYSDDTSSAVEGGDLGWLGKGQTVSEFETAAFSLEPGKISDPVKTTFGFHIIRVDEKDANHPLDQYTLMQNQYEAYNKWLSDIKSQAKIVRNWSMDKVPPTPSAVSRQ